VSKLVDVSVRMYQVGFGDCFLVSFQYDGPAAPGTRDQRHMLIDFGRNTRPHFGGDLKEVAQSIKDRCEGDLDAIVVTHRHEDHLSAFGQKSVAKLIGDCAPRLIVRSWTEDPAADANAGAPALAANRRFLAGIRTARAFAAEVAGGFSLDATDAGRRLKGAADTAVANQAAVDQLTTWGEASTREYLHHGVPTSLGNLIPGVDFQLLSPPLPTDFPDIAKQIDDNSEEFWHLWTGRLRLALAGVAEVDPAADGGRARAGARAAGPEAPGEIGPVRWLTERVRRQQVTSVLRIVRWLDDVMNNTSVVLLITAGDRRMLFPGDAQYESWQWITQMSPDAARNREALAKVDLYKVGHHGSRNATPKQSLYKLWAPDGAPARPVLSLMSTREDVYGESDQTDVPNTKLKAGLTVAPMRLLTTLQDPAAGDDRILALEVSAPAMGPGGFEVKAPIRRP
jgi:hypothetical protein